MDHMTPTDNLYDTKYRSCAHLLMTCMIYKMDHMTPTDDLCANQDVSHYTYR